MLIRSEFVKIMELKAGYFQIAVVNINRIVFRLMDEATRHELIVNYKLHSYLSLSFNALLSKCHKDVNVNS